MKCLNHPEKDAVSMCVSCGVGLCADCRKVVRGATYCEECEKTHQPMRVYPGTSAGTNVWAVVAWILAVVGWYPGLQFVSIGGLILGFVALGDIALRGYAQAGRAYAYAAIVCAALGIITYGGLMFYMLVNGMEISPWLDPFKYLDFANGR